MALLSDNVRIGIPMASIDCPDDIEVTITTGTDCSAVVTFNDPVVIGTANVPTQTAGLPSGSDFPVGTTTNTYEVLDDDGNLLTCSFDVTVIDGVAPTITCPEDQLLTAASGETTVDLPDYTGDATASDNCTDPVTVTQDPAPGTVVDIGATETVTLTATDEAGNTTTCTFDVVVDALGSRRCGIEC